MPIRTEDAGRSVFDRVDLQRFEVHELQHQDVARFQHHRRQAWPGSKDCTRLRIQTHQRGREIVFWALGDEVVAVPRKIVQKWLGDWAANRMQPAILWPRAAITSQTGGKNRRPLLPEAACVACVKFRGFPNQGAGVTFSTRAL